MSALRQHVQRQQDLACNLSGILEAAHIVDKLGVAPEALSKLVDVALTLAGELYSGLDVASLPDGGSNGDA